MRLIQTIRSPADAMQDLRGGAELRIPQTHLGTDAALAPQNHALARGGIVSEFSTTLRASGGSGHTVEKPDETGGIGQWFARRGYEMFSVNTINGRRPGLNVSGAIGVLSRPVKGTLRTVGGIGLSGLIIGVSAIAAVWGLGEHVVNLVRGKGWGKSGVWGVIKETWVGKYNIWTGDYGIGTIFSDAARNFVFAPSRDAERRLYEGYRY